MSCFEGSCNGSWANTPETHTTLHWKKFNHSVFLNIRKHVEKANIPAEDITKIAIGTPGGGGMEIETVTFQYSLLCTCCKVRVTDIPEHYRPLVHSIEQHQSAYEKAQVVSWELEENPCPHSRQIVQQPTQIPNIESNHSGNHIRDIGKCVDCSLTSNLWLCLTCGNVGCGRKNFDGSGGNSHGIGHFDATKHPISVKTGTISPTDSPSAYCYLCNDEVKVPQVLAYLQVLGLNPAIMKKTEKTMNEMSLDYNRNLKLTDAFEKEGQYEKIISKIRPYGLTNIGNSCYMNAVLQCIASLPELGELFSISSSSVRDHIETKCNSPPSECLVCQVSKLVGAFTEGDVHDGSIDIRPYIFRHLVGKDHLEFRTQKQQDASEYLGHLFQVLKNAEKILNVIFSSLFRYRSTTKLTCSSGCGSYYCRENKGQILDINFKDNLIKEIQESQTGQSTEANLSKILNEGIEQSEQVMDCAECKGKRLFKARVYLSHFPKYLILRIQNFVQDHFQVKKINIDLSFNPEDINLNSIDSNSAFQGVGRKLELEKGGDLNEDLVNELISMGFSSNRSKRALMETNNNLENAINLLFSVGDDPSFDKPLESLKKIKQTDNHTNNALVDDVWNVVNDFGVPRDYVVKVCRLFESQGIEYIVNYFLEHPDDDLPDSETQNQKDSQSTEQEFTEDNGGRVYKAIGSVVHLGASVHVGHYVAFARRSVDGKEEWVYFNDDQIYHALYPSLNKSYLLFLQKI
jgi:ubiquitin carboxyl-terminal hydrolase 5/13